MKIEFPISLRSDMELLTLQCGSVIRTSLYTDLNTGIKKFACVKLENYLIFLSFLATFFNINYNSKKSFELNNYSKQFYSSFSALRKIFGDFFLLDPDPHPPFGAGSRRSPIMRIWIHVF